MDEDDDGLDDDLESDLLDQYAPVVLLHPTEAYWPANVDWYLGRSFLGINHCAYLYGLGHICSNLSCSVVVDTPNLNQQNLLEQEHHKLRIETHNGHAECVHYNEIAYPWGTQDPYNFFYVQPASSSDKYGIQPSDSASGGAAGWVVYGHVYPNNFCGINIMYRFFYAYSVTEVLWDWYAHFGDWEQIVVELYPDNATVRDVVYFQHGNPHVIAVDDVTWHAGDHPVVVAAEGNHASYPDGDCPWWEDCHWDDPVLYSEAWFTWAGGRPAGAPGFQGGGVINVGERSWTRQGELNGQEFIHYTGSWEHETCSTSAVGEFHDEAGESSSGSGDSWNYNRGDGSTYDNSPPFSPSNSAPTDGAVDVGSDALLSWTGGDPDSGNATITYDVFFDTSNPPTQQVSSSQSGTTFAPGPLSLWTTYYWRVVARDGCGATTVGPIWQFRSAGELPAAPAPSWPEGGINADLSSAIRLDWNSVNAEPTVDKYTVVVRRADNDQVNLCYDNQVTATYYDCQYAWSYGEQYKWMVRAHNEVGWGPWSNWTSFEILVPPPPGDVPEAPILLSPTNNATVYTLTPTLQWMMPDGDVDSPRLARERTSAREEAGFSVKLYHAGALILDLSAGGTIYQVPGGFLAYGQQYQWNVTAQNDVGWGPPSTTRSFTVQRATPSEEEAQIK